MKKVLQLVKLNDGYKKQLTDMMTEWCETGEKIIPWSIVKNDYCDFDTYLQGIEEEEKGLPGLVPGTTLFCLDTDRDIFVGAVNIRHYLNESLLLTGGHIGDGVRPSERGKGIATQIIALALEECKALGIDKVLITCNNMNVASAKSIIKNGGILENEVEVDGKITQRYWITI